MEDYNPGDTSILIEGDEKIIDKFPSNGIITLTEQCSDIDRRALSFYYNSRTSSSFDELELLPEFKGLEISKPKKLTNVTMNVLDKHHNHLKDTLIAVENFLGTKFDDGQDKTLTGRIKHLEKLVFSPKAWFSVSSQVGLAPLKVEFKNQSIRLGSGSITEEWDFGEGSDPIVIVSDTEEEYLSKQGSIEGVEYFGTTVTKTYSNPGIYSVKLTMTNEFGQSTVEFDQIIIAKNESPEKAAIVINPRPSQNYTDSDPPKIRSIANSFIYLEVPTAQGVALENPDNLGYSYGGELLSTSGTPVDEIKEYSWYLDDDLPHANSPDTRASYSLGGYYDINLRVDTEFGSYTITSYEDAIDIVESKNLWLFNYKTPNNDSSGTIQAFEFGLNSETFKTLGNQIINIERSNEFLNKTPYSYGSNEYYNETLKRARKEFQRNVEFVPSGTTTSGNRGNALLLWASGGSTTDQKNIHIKKYNAFNDVYETLPSISDRPWNWVALNSLEKIYFILGHGNVISEGLNQASNKRTDYDLASESASIPTELQISNFENGADELLNHPSYFDEDGVPTNGYFAVYRSAWKDSTGYILRNSSVNEFYRLGSFYKTKGTASSPFNTITKLPDVVGSVKLEGQLVTLSNGIFLFDNSGEICAWNDTSLTWEVGRANSSSLSFRSVQDTNIDSFEDKSNTLLATSDKDRIAYLSYDYSDKVFIKFNATDLTFSTTRFRPAGVQFKMGIY
jgi:PKD repeat protein